MKRDSVRTTVDTPISLYRKLKQQAAAKGRSVRELILAASEPSCCKASGRGPKRVKFPLIVSDGPKVGCDQRTDL
jgi:hypothetical protein